MSFPVKTLSRRQFLVGLKAALVPMPFLPSLVKGAYADSSESGRLNFVSVRSIYGQLPQIYYPNERPTQKIDEHAYYRAFSQGEIISEIINSSFKPVAHKLSLLRGVDCSWGGHNHSTMLAPSSYNGDFGNPTHGTSLDEIIARSSLYPITPAQRILHIEPYREGWGYSWYKGTRQPYDANMDSLKTKLFGNGYDAGSGGSTDSQTQQALKAVDIAKPAYDALRSSNKMSQVDKDRLSDYLDMLTDLEGKLESQRNLSSCSPPSINTSSKGGEHDASIDLTIAALVCGMTKVASLSMATWGELPGENGTDFHTPSHWTYETAHTQSTAFGNDYLIDSRGSSKEAHYLRLYSYAANKVGELMSKMDSITEANGKTLLDNSIVFWGNEQSGSSAHGYQSQPIVVGGTAHGQFTPGYWDFTHKPHLFYAGRTDIHPAVGTVPYTNFLVTLGHALGLEQSEWEAYNNGNSAGFGDFRLQSYDYNGSGSARSGTDIYAPFVGNDAAKRKTIPHWFNKA